MVEPKFRVSVTFATYAIYDDVGNSLEFGIIIRRWLRLASVIIITDHDHERVLYIG